MKPVRFCWVEREELLLPALDARASLKPVRFCWVEREELLLPALDARASLKLAAAPGAQGGGQLTSRA